VVAIEFMNHRTIAIVREWRSHLVVPAGEGHMLLVELEGLERQAQVDQVAKVVQQTGYSPAGVMITVEGEHEQARLWRTRKALPPIIRG
jgi:FAD/FMN-containing dehydrogenase